MDSTCSADEVLQANLKLYELTAKTYDTEQPHFSPENKQLFSKKLEKLSGEAGNSVLVDLGCGTGFVPSLATPFFEKIYGVDASPDMLAMVNTESGKVTTVQA